MQDREKADFGAQVLGIGGDRAQRLGARVEENIDYGPYGWLEGYDMRWTPNTTDVNGRYSFGNQPAIALWNLARLADALTPLIEPAVLEKSLAVFGATLEPAANRMLADKLGLISLEQAGDDQLVRDLFEWLRQVETDMTLFFRSLAALPIAANADTADDTTLIEPLRRAFYTEQAFAPTERNNLAGWLRRYSARVRQDARPLAERRDAMNRTNPKYVLRNYLAQQQSTRSNAAMRRSWSA